MINISQAKAIIATGEHCARLEAMADELPETAFANRICAGLKRTGWKTFAAWRRGQKTARPDVQIGPDDYLHVIDSSGTTGLTQGIVHTHRGRRDWAYYLAITLTYNSA